MTLVGPVCAVNLNKPRNALAVADQALPMLGQTDSVSGSAADVLTEQNLSSLYGVTLKEVAFEHEGRKMETFAPILPAVA